MGREDNSNNIRMRKIGDRNTLAISSWRFLLDYLHTKLKENDDIHTARDVEQLLGLCNRMDEDAFLPLRSEELNSAIGSRILQFYNLIDSVAKELEQNSIAQITGRVSYGRGWYYRPIKIHGCGGALQLNAEFWARERYTPIWLSVWDQNWKPTQGLKDALSPLQYRDPPQLVFVGEYVVVPLRPTLGVEEDQVRRDLVKQIREVAELLKEYEPPSPDESDKPSSVTENELPELATEELNLEKQ